VWETRYKYAICALRKIHKPPAKRCSCGIYGIRKFKDLPRKFYKDSKDFCLGIISLGGDIIPDSDATVRAAKAELVCLFVKDTIKMSSNQKHILTWRYGVPIYKVSDFNLVQIRRAVGAFFKNLETLGL